jgi:hypothetical protein
MQDTETSSCPAHVDISVVVKLDPRPDAAIRSLWFLGLIGFLIDGAVLDHQVPERLLNTLGQRVQVDGELPSYHSMSAVR